MRYKLSLSYFMSFGTMCVVYVDVKINHIISQCVFVSNISLHLQRWKEIDGWVRNDDILRSYRACSSYEAAKILFNLLFIATLHTCDMRHALSPIEWANKVNLKGVKRIVISFNGSCLVVVGWESTHTYLKSTLTFVIRTNNIRLSWALVIGRFRLCEMKMYSNKNPCYIHAV